MGNMPKTAIGLAIGTVGGPLGMAIGAGIGNYLDFTHNIEESAQRQRFNGKQFSDDM